MSFFHPVSNKLLLLLNQLQCKELDTWSSEHSSIFDIRLHSLDTCPFLVYIPAYLSHDRKSKEWAEWLHDFFGHKHKEENKCNCDALIKSFNPLIK